MNRLDCRQLLPHLESYLRGDASEELRLLADDHLARCTSCRRRLAHLKQVTAMLAAWRPMPVPPGLKTETAAALGRDLGRRAREVFPRRRFLGRRRREPLRPPAPMTGYQRAATWLVIAALLFLGAAIAYRILQQWM